MNFLAFKFFVIFGICLLGFILLKTDRRHKQRPILILCLYMGYVAFQCLFPTEFFPLSTFPARSFPESQAAQYVKVLKVTEGGAIAPLMTHPLLVGMTGGRQRRPWEKIYNNPDACNRFAKDYSVYDFERDSTAGRPVVKEVHFENWKWDWLVEPQDPNQGFLVKRMVCKA